MRPSGRTADQLRPVVIETGVNKHAEGSCLIQCGDTRVLCTASIDPKVPSWLRHQGRGWVTAEYGMLPRATGVRMDREAARGKQSGRTQEIQRLIGRSLRAVVDLAAMGEMQVKVDCDVLQADGGTRTASITGAYVALSLAFAKTVADGRLGASPLIASVAAVSCGLYQGEAVMDLDYAEDAVAQADANFVLTGEGRMVEIQGTAEEFPFTREQFERLLDLAEVGVGRLSELQRQALASAQGDKTP